MDNIAKTAPPKHRNNARFRTKNKYKMLPYKKHSLVSFTQFKKTSFDSQIRKTSTVESRYLEYSISRTLDVSNKTIGPILINLHKMTIR